MYPKKRKISKDHTIRICQFNGRDYDACWKKCTFNSFLRTFEYEKSVSLTVVYEKTRQDVWLGMRSRQSGRSEVIFIDTCFLWSVVFNWGYFSLIVSEDDMHTEMLEIFLKIRLHQRKVKTMVFWTIMKSCMTVRVIFKLKLC